MILSRRKFMLWASGSMLLVPVLVGCDDEGPAEEAGEKIDDAAEEAGDKLEDVGDTLEDKTD